MSLSRWAARNTGLVTFVLLAALCASAPIATAEVRIEIDIADTTIYPPYDNFSLPVYFGNYFDTVAGFNIWIQMDRPDLMEFGSTAEILYDTTYWRCDQFDGDVCVESTLVSSEYPWDFIHVDTIDTHRALLDTTATLIGGWEFVRGRSLSGLYLDNNVVGIADLVPPGGPPDLAPQTGGTLIKLPLTVNPNIPDIITDSTVNFFLNVALGQHFSFSDPHGNTIGVITVPVVDTLCFNCVEWVGDVCVNWAPTPCPGDTTVYDTTWVTQLDTTQFIFLDGSVTLGACGYSGESFDISYLVAVVEYMFNEGSPLRMEEADCNCDCKIDITDLICFVDHMFNGGPPPGCQ